MNRSSKYLFILGLLFSLSISAQQFKPEKRIYMLDATSSMERLKVDSDTLWSVVKKSLEKAILEIDDTSTLVVVSPFWERVLDVWSAKATMSGKQEIISKIKNLQVGGRTTNITAALEKGYSLMDNQYVNYLFLMTDGKHNTQTSLTPVELIGNWRQNNVSEKYGFYVMLHDEAAKDNTIRKAVEEQSNMWVVKSADINIDLFKMPSKIIYNVRNDKNYRINLIGPTHRVKSDFKIVLSLEENPYFKLSGGTGSVNSSIIDFTLMPKTNLAQIPENTKFKLKVNTCNKSEFEFVLPSEIILHCFNKKERTLKIHVKNER